MPAGQNKVEIVFEDLKLRAVATVMIELLQRSPTSQGRVLYDGSGAESVLQFRCIPPKGKTTSCAG